VAYAGAMDKAFVESGGVLGPPVSAVPSNSEPLGSIVSGPAAMRAFAASVGGMTSGRNVETMITLSPKYLAMMHANMGPAGGGVDSLD
jgi:hypothetical protein